MKQGLVWAVEAAPVLGKREQANELLTMVEQLPPGCAAIPRGAHTHRPARAWTATKPDLATVGSFRE